MPRRVKVDWSRPLAVPLNPGRGKPFLRTLADVRAYLLRRPPAQEARWEGVAGALLDAARGGDVKRVNAEFKVVRQQDRR